MWKLILGARPSNTLWIVKSCLCHGKRVTKAQLGWLPCCAELLKEIETVLVYVFSPFGQNALLLSFNVRELSCRSLHWRSWTQVLSPFCSTLVSILECTFWTRIAVSPRKREWIESIHTWEGCVKPVGAKMQLRGEWSADGTTWSHLWDLAAPLVKILDLHEFPEFIWEMQ